MKHLRRWGVVYVFLGMWLGTGAVHYHYLGEKLRVEAAEHGQEFSEEDRRTEWLADTFENHQSEYAQLFFQTLLAIGAAGLIFRKQNEDIDRIERKIDDIKSRLLPRSTGDGPKW